MTRKGYPARDVLTANPVDVMIITKINSLVRPSGLETNESKHEEAPLEPLLSSLDVEPKS